MLVIIALGQELRRDDAAGLAIVREWQRAYPHSAADPEVHIEMAGLAGLNLLTFLELADAAILVDCVRSNAPAGTLFMLEESELASFCASSGSAHGWGVADTIALGRSIGAQIPANLTILAIAAADLSLGEGLSPDVQSALPAAAGQIEKLYKNYIVFSKFSR